MGCYFAFPFVGVLVERRREREGSCADENGGWWVRMGCCGSLFRSTKELRIRIERGTKERNWLSLCLVIRAEQFVAWRGSERKRRRIRYLRSSRSNVRRRKKSEKRGENVCNACVDETPEKIASRGRGPGGRGSGKGEFLDE
jgi:hypothetical protein